VVVVVVVVDVVVVVVVVVVVLRSYVSSVRFNGQSPSGPVSSGTRIFLF